MPSIVQVFSALSFVNGTRRPLTVIFALILMGLLTSKMAVSGAPVQANIPQTTMDGTVTDIRTNNQDSGSFVDLIASRETRQSSTNVPRQSMDVSVKSIESIKFQRSEKSIV